MSPAGLERRRRHATPAPEPTGRFAPGWALPALASALLAIVCAIALLAELYESVATGQRLRGLHHEATGRSSQIALALLPWKADARRMLALNGSIAGRSLEATEQAREALRWAPAEAESWRVLARTLLRTPDSGAMLTRAVAQAQVRAPQSPALHLALALDALVAWPHASAELRALWLKSLRFSLARDSLKVLRWVAALHRENAFCHYVGNSLRRRDWCAKVARVRADCSRLDLEPGQRHWCFSVGMGRAVPP